MFKQFLAIVFVYFVSVESIQAQSMTENMCQAHLVIIDSAINLRNQGAPISIAQGVADSSFDLDRNLWLFLRQAISDAYRDPIGTKQALDNGQLLQICVQRLMGG